MKRTLLTILPIAAALLLATSCSKDSDNDNGTDDVHIVSTANTGTDDVHIVSTDESDAIPFSIKVVTSNDGLSKIGYADADGKVTPSFTADDVTGNLKMTLTDGGSNTYGTLELKDTDGNFSGTLTTEPVDDATVTATITTTGNTTSSTVSITDLMANCAHTYTGSFVYKTDTKVMLTDDKAYIEIFMSPLQHNIDVTIGSDKQNFAMSDDGKVWIAVDGGTKFTMNFTNEKTATAGKITTIKREGLVDLGLSDGTLWADKNVDATTYDGDGTKLSWYDATSTYTTTLSVPKTGDGNPCMLLVSECTWQWVTSYNSGTRAGLIIFKNGGSDISKDPHIFLPAAGWSDGSSTNIKCVYWTGTPHPTYTNNACRMHLDATGRDVELNDEKTTTYNVRLVRCK